MNIKEEVLKEIVTCINNFDENQLLDVINSISKKDRIFVHGEGRSGLMAKSFAMRLMHIGFNVYVIGETVTPAIKRNDVYISISGSGETKFVIDSTKKAKELGCKIIGFTCKKDSTLANISDNLVIVEGVTKADSGENRGSIQLLSSLFDQSLHIVLDILCLMISKRYNISTEDAVKQHTNIQ